MKVIIISAMAENRVIGQKGKLPWDIPEEYQLFQKHVRGNTVIMGRKSYEIFGEDLTHVHNLVLSKSSDKIPNAIVCKSLTIALSHAYERARDIYIAGGASIYKQSLPFADELYLSTIKGRYQGETYFPAIDLRKWELVSEREYFRFIFRIWRSASPS